MTFKPNRSTGLKLDNCTDGIVRNNVSVGHEVGIEVTNSSGVAIVGNVVVAPGATDVFLDLAAAIDASSLDQSTKEELVAGVREMGERAMTSDFISKYKNFMALLADHMQVLGPVVAPFLPALAVFL